MKKYNAYRIIIIINSVLVLMLGMHTARQIDDITNLEEQREQLMEEYIKLQSDYAGLEQEVEEWRTENEELTHQLFEQKRIVPEGWQPFYGQWLSCIYYTSNKEGIQECWKEIKIQPKYIQMTGKNHLTDAPIFDIAVRISSDVADELKSIGVEDENLVNMLQAECYAELDISNTYNWHRELFPEEVDLVENAKYYIIDNQTMLCISKNNGGRVYVFQRSTY